MGDRHQHHDPRDNLVYIEDAAFNRFAWQDNIASVRTDPTTGETILPNGRRLAPFEPQSFARERGARRAGLQQAIRTLPTKPPTRPGSSRHRFVFPIPAATLVKVCEDADGPHWTSLSLDLSGIPEEELETMPTTISYREWLRRATSMRRLAKMRAEEKPLPVTLPSNVVNGGPFVWHKLDAVSQANQDLFKKCSTTMEMLKAARRRTPRPLLDAVIRIAQRAAVGEFDDHLPVDEVQLAKDELEEVRDGEGLQVPKLLNRWEVQWLRFLAQDGVNDKNWTGKFTPDTPKEKYQLYQLFASKVQKLLDDKDPDGLFSRHDAEVDVDQLLRHINSGQDSGVSKPEFHPYDACCWLDRMKEGGHVR